MTPLLCLMAQGCIMKSFWLHVLLSNLLKNDHGGGGGKNHDGLPFLQSTIGKTNKSPLSTPWCVGGWICVMKFLVPDSNNFPPLNFHLRH